MKKFGLLALVIAIVSIVPMSSKAESCIVDLEYETSLDTYRQPTIYVGRDESGVVLCLGEFNLSSAEMNNPRVIARATSSGLCVTESGTREGSGRAPIDSIDVSVSQGTILLEAPRGLVCEDIGSISPNSGVEGLSLREFAGISTSDSNVQVEMFVVDTGDQMRISVDSDEGGSTRSSSDCVIGTGHTFVAYGAYMYNSTQNNNYMIVCDTLNDVIVCIENAPTGSVDTASFTAHNNGVYVFTPSSTAYCATGYGSDWEVAPWPASWYGRVAFYGGDSGDVFHGSPNDDVIDGGDGDDMLYGGAGDDDILGGYGSDRSYGEAGNDYLANFGCAEPENDTTTDGEYLVGGGGSDIIHGAMGDDDIWGDFVGTGSGGMYDYIYSYEGDDTIYGGEGGDYINAGEDSDYCNGGVGVDGCYDCETSISC